MVHFELSNSGELELEGFGERTKTAIFKRAYPVLNEARLNAPWDENEDLTPEGAAVIRKAVGKERKRVRPKKVKEPETELGRGIKKMMNAPTRMIDRTIRDSATKTLKQIPVKGKPN